MFLIVLPDPSTEDHLLNLLNRSGKDAVTVIYEHFFPPLYQYVRLRVGDNFAAQDIVSEVFMRLIESIGRPSAPRDNLRAWLFRVARNEVYRTYGKIRHLTDLDEWLPDTEENNPEWGDHIDIERVRHALRMLAVEHQEILILRFAQRLTLKETADIMGKSVSAIKSQQFRAVDTLRSILVKNYREAANG